MPRPYAGPRLWLDPRRGTWTILDGRKRVRTGFTEAQRDLAVVAIHQYSSGTYTPERPQGPKRTYKTPPRRGVYVAGFDSYVKIGISTNIDERLCSLQVPVPLTLYGILDGWQREEQELHVRFANHRLNGEWFRLDGELAAWVEGLKCQMKQAA